MYSYTGNNPVNYVDPTGHMRENMGNSGNSDYEAYLREQIAYWQREAERAARRARNIEYGLYCMNTMLLGIPINAYERSVRMEQDPSFRNIADVITWGTISVGEGALFPENPGSLEHIMDCIDLLGRATIVYSVVSESVVLYRMAGQYGVRYVQNPLANIQYTDKVLEQMKLGDYHSFPQTIDQYGSIGEVTPVTGGDGITRSMVEIPGSINGVNGVYQYIIEPNDVCNHRIFVPGRR